jgi:hypothetical protein
LLATVYYDEEPVEYEMLDGFRAFSYKHIALGDVDPIYAMIRNSALNYNEKKRFIFSHLMVYDLKTSIALSDIKDDQLYYDKLLYYFQEAKVGKDRKDVASRETNIKSRMFGTQLPKMRLRSPEDWVEDTIQATQSSKSWGVSLKTGKNIPTFGEYFAFKLADMIETIFDVDEYTVTYNKEFIDSIPRGSLTGYEMTRTGSTHKFRSKEEIRRCSLMSKFYNIHLEFFSSINCPHKPSRAIGVQEIETLLCDYRKVCKGILLYGDKVLKLKDGIEVNKKLETAQRLLVGAQPLLTRRTELLELGIMNINETHCNHWR